MSKQAGSDNSKSELKKLTEREESLCQAMLVSDNQSEAFRKSKYATDKMSQATINKQASRYFQKPHIRGRMAQLTKKRNKKAGIDAEWVLNEAVDLYKECRIEGDRAQANKSLDTIGKHVDVQAWKEKSDVTLSGDVDMNVKYSILGVD